MQCIYGGISMNFENTFGFFLLLKFYIEFASLLLRTQQIALCNYAERAFPSTGVKYSISLAVSVLITIYTNIIALI